MGACDTPVAAEFPPADLDKDGIALRTGADAIVPSQIEDPANRKRQYIERGTIKEQRISGARFHGQYTNCQVTRHARIRSIAGQHPHEGEQVLFELCHLVAREGVERRHHGTPHRQVALSVFREEPLKGVDVVY